MLLQKLKRKDTSDMLNEIYEYKMKKNNFIYHIPSSIGLKRDIENIEKSYVMTVETVKNWMERLIDVGRNNKLFINCAIAITAGVAIMYNIRVDEIQYVSRALIDLANLICGVGWMTGVIIERVCYNRFEDDRMINVIMNLFKVTGFWGFIYATLRVVIRVFLI